MTYDTLAKIAEFEALVVAMTIDPLGVDWTLESVAELYARWSQLRRAGFEIDPQVEDWLLRVNRSTGALNAEGDADRDHLSGYSQALEGVPMEVAMIR